MFTSPILIRIRGITRRIGLNQLLGRLSHRGHYEDRFGPAIKHELRVGDTVWDIGANVGLYTRDFLDCVGPSGRVVAFEPVPACFAKLVEHCESMPQAVLKNIAMGDADGEIAMSLESDELAATHRVVNANSPGASGLVKVGVRSADSLVAEEPQLFPHVVKIDVEGHEGAVMSGMQHMISDQRLRCVGIEVHFGLLDARGERDQPKQIEQILIRNGFHVRWTDSSHLLAIR